jgi:hypothetical protein
VRRKHVLVDLADQIDRLYEDERGAADADRRALSRQSVG